MLRVGVRRARFRLISDVDAGIDDSRQKASRAITKKELTYLLSRPCTVDATTMGVRSVVNGQVVPPFAEGATLP